jgi:hypothetical protein
MSNFLVCIFTTDVRMVYLLSSVAYSSRSDSSPVRNAGVGLLSVRLLDGTIHQTVPRARCKTLLETAVSAVTSAAGPVTVGCPICTEQNAVHKMALFRTPPQKSPPVAKPSA